jgi:hypothetical protein
MQLTRDPFVLSLASNRDGIQIADPVQLYLDCRSAGEGALEAADAIRGHFNHHCFVRASIRVNFRAA